VRRDGCALAPNAWMVLPDGALPREEEVDLLVGPTDSQIGRGAHCCRSTTDDDHRLGRGDGLMMEVDLGVDLLPRLQLGLAPESVRHTGRHHQDVVRLDGEAAVGESDGDLARIEVDAGQHRMHAAYAVEPPIASEGDTVVPGPIVGPRQPHP
jgi:hypothetical protein